MTLKAKIFSVISLAGVLVAVSLITVYSQQSSPSFYLGTDRSFGAEEKPYVNIEGDGSREYSFRVYRVDGIDDFFSKSVKKRFVKESNDTSYGNAVAIFKETFNSFKKDFRSVARAELNSSTRSETKRIAGIDFEAPYEPGENALPSFVKNHTYLFSFSVPKGKSEWSYRRVPVPVKDNGVYLVEAVSGKNLGYTVIVKSGINFVTKQADNETVIFAARRNTGAPIDKAEVKILNENGTVLFSGMTVEGLCSYSGKSAPKSLVIVKKNGEYALSDPEFYSRSFYGEGGIRSFIYTDRPVYRPGDTVSFKGIVRNFKGDDYAAAAGAGVVNVSTEDGSPVQSGIQVSVSNDLGTFEGTFVLPKENDQYLGTYNLILNFAGKNYSTEFAVDAYKKPSYLVKVIPQKKTYIGSEKIDMTVTAKYYYGSPVSNESVRYRVFRRKKFDFSPVGSIPFFADAAEYLGMVNAGTNDLVAQGDGKLDGRGNFEFSIVPESVDTDYTYSILADVTTADSTISGAASVSVNRSAFFIRTVKDLSVCSPGETMTVGVKLIPFDSSLSGKSRTDLVGERKVRAVLYSRSFINIAHEGERKEIKTIDIKTNALGEASFPFLLPSKGHYIVVISAKDAEGKETFTETPFWASNKADSIEMPFRNITLKSSKDLYEAGEDADILIMTPVSDGTVFVTLEGNRILSKEIIKMQGNSLRYRTKISSAMTPNFTLSVVQFSGNDIYKNQIKIVAPPKEKFLSVKISSAKTEYVPGETAELLIETADWKSRGIPAEVSVAVVDDAVYQIREDQKPSLATFFYHPRTNNVSTVFSAAYRFFGYSEEKRLQLALNSRQNQALSALKEEDAKAREKFKDTTYWSAKVMTDVNGKAVIKVPLAENITTWRVTALAVTGDTKVGQGRTQFIAKKNLMMNAGLPSYMIRGADHSVIANVTNLTTQAVDAVVNARAEGGLILGSTSQTIKIPAGKTEHVYFSIKPSEDSAVDFCAVDLAVTGAGLSDGSKTKIPLKYFGRAESSSVSIRLMEENDKASASFVVPQKGSDISCSFRLSSGCGDALRQSLSYLADYPYGCIEQTMSRFMPLLAAKQAGYISPKLKENLPRMVDLGMKLIQSHQKEDGGFGWYGEQGTDAMMSAYVYRGLLTAGKNFPPIDRNTAARVRYFLHASLDKRTLSPFEKAYIIFSLSEGEKMQKSMIDSLLKETSREGLYPRALAVLTLINQGEKGKARGIMDQLVREYSQKERPQGIKGENEGWENDEVETASALLTASVRLGSYPEFSEKVSSDIVAMRNGIAWKNSRDTAFAVLSLSEKLKSAREKEGSSDLQIIINGKTAQTVKVSSSEVESGSTKINVPSSFMKNGENEITMIKKGGGAVYASAVVSYYDRSSSLPPVQNGFSVSRAYYDVDVQNSDSGVDLSLKETAGFRVGSLVMVEIKAEKKNGSGDYIMIEDAVPPGFSVVKQDGEYYSDRYAKEYSQRQIYDDRAVFFVKGPVRSTVIRYFIRAEIPGKYSSLPPTASMMYYTDQNGSGSDEALTIEK